MCNNSKVKKVEVLVLVDAGIGNCLQALYAIEYLHRINVQAGIFLGNINKSFREFLTSCYKDSVIYDLNSVSCVHLVHGFTYHGKDLPLHDNYIYVSGDYHSSKFYSETEQFLNIVKSLYPGGVILNTLELLKEDYSKKVQNVDLEKKIILYPGGSSANSIKRWPHFTRLFELIGSEKAIIIGGNDDLNFERSYSYPKWLNFLPQSILNQKRFYSILMKLGLLDKWSHHKLNTQSEAFFNEFSWEELVAVFRRAKYFIGNDGGLSHLAGACGMNGSILFGPTSPQKNRPFNKNFDIISRKEECSPCQFGVGKVQLSGSHINCPYSVRCLNKISPEHVLEKILE